MRGVAMITFFVRRDRLKKLFLLGVAVCMVNFLSIRYFAQEDLENADLNYVKGKKIMIDPGHGGIDSGAQYNHILEKDITLAMSFKLGTILESHGASVMYTRDSDLDYYTKGKGGKRNDLQKRIDMINQSGADLFISIHCNAVKDGRWSGSQVFYNSKIADNKELAEIMQQLLKRHPANNKRQEKDDNKIFILKAADVPGVLLETGYLSNKQEADLLSDQDYQNTMMQQVAKTFANYFKTKG